MAQEGLAGAFDRLRGVDGGEDGLAVEDCGQGSD